MRKPMLFVAMLLTATLCLASTKLASSDERSIDSVNRNLRALHAAAWQYQKENPGFLPATLNAPRFTALLDEEAKSFLEDSRLLSMFTLNGKSVSAAAATSDPTRMPQFIYAHADGRISICFVAGYVETFVPESMVATTRPAVSIPGLTEPSK